MKIRTFALHAVPLIFSTWAHAGELMSVGLEITPAAETLRRGDFAELTFTVDNVASVPLDEVTVGFTFRTFGPESTLFPFRVDATLPCFYAVEGPSPRPGQPGVNVLSISVLPRPIAVAEGRSCTVGIRISPDAAAPFVQQFGFQASAGVATETVSHFVVFPLGDPPPLVPTLSLHWLWLLGGLVAGIGAWAIRR